MQEKKKGKEKILFNFFNYTLNSCYFRSNNHECMKKERKKNQINAGLDSSRAWIHASCEYYACPNTGRNGLTPFRMSLSYRIVFPERDSLLHGRKCHPSLGLETARSNVFEKRLDRRTGFVFNISRFDREKKCLYPFRSTYS